MQSPMPPGWGRSLCARYSRRRRTRCTRSARFTTSNQVLKARIRSRASAASRPAVRATSVIPLSALPSRRSIAATRSPSTSPKSRSPPWSRRTSPTSPPSACTSSRRAVSFSGNWRFWRWITGGFPRGGLVVVAVRPVNVAVGDFLVRGLAHLRDLDREMQRAAGERMIAVDRHEIAVHAHDRHDARSLRAARPAPACRAQGPRPRRTSSAARSAPGARRAARSPARAPPSRPACRRQPCPTAPARGPG